MHRTEGTYHSSNLFTDGPPGTRLEENWLNAVQEEICNVIETAGITLKTAASETRDQLYDAIIELITSEIYSARLVGRIVLWPSGTLPLSGYLECNGAAVNRTTYSDLFSVIGTDFGIGDGTTTFNLPDLRGEFLRGYDHGAGNDPNAATRTDRGDGTAGDNVGTKQADEFKSHRHTSAAKDAAEEHIVAAGLVSVARYGSATAYSGGDETRPRNVSLMLMIQY